MEKASTKELDLFEPKYENMADPWEKASLKTIGYSSAFKLPRILSDNESFNPNDYNKEIYKRKRAILGDKDRNKKKFSRLSLIEDFNKNGKLITCSQLK